MEEIGNSIERIMESDIFKKFGSSVNDNLSPLERMEKEVERRNKEAGTLNKNLAFAYDCKECLNRGYIWFIDEYENYSRRECSCMTTRQAFTRIAKSGLEEAIRKYTFENFIVSEEWQKFIKNKAQSFCSDAEAKWFYIGGQSGSGKSHLCTAIAAYYLWSGKDLRYMRWAEESKKLKALVNDISYQSEVDKWKSIPVLYIDDFLKVESGGKPTPADMRLAFEIIDGRLNDSRKITIISSERTIAEHMKVGADEATIGRIYHAAGDYTVSIPKDRKKNYRFKSKSI